MTRYAVTGGAGFIGSNIVGDLVARGHDVIVVDDLSSGNTINLKPFPEITFKNVSILDEHCLNSAFEGVDTVFHLAASVGNKRSIDNPALDSKINVVGTINVLEACRKADVRKIVVSSSAGIFGELHKLPISEDHPVEPDSPYGASKLASEKLCLAYAKLYDIEAIALRYFNVFGRNQRFDAYGNVIPIFVFKMLNGEPITIFGDGEQTRDFISVIDVVQANIKAAETTGLSGAFNIASGARLTINDLVARLSELVPAHPKVSYGPERPGDVRDSQADITAARQAFGFEPSITISDGLSDYVRWAMDEASLI
ncbi:MAG: NAD-dependent epimerase/dehydratase family protein [Dehalococcoidia bacterium]